MNETFYLQLIFSLINETAGKGTYIMCNNN